MRQEFGTTRCETLCWKLDFEQHSFDKRSLYHHDNDSQLDAVLIFHVDDLMCAYSEAFPLHILENLFEWGSVTKVDEQHPGEYRGKDQLTQQDCKLIYKVTQKKFLDNLDEGRIKPGRLQQEPKLTANEWKEMRSVCGCLQRIAGQTRPDVASTASLSHRGQNTDIHDLKKFHDTLKYAASKRLQIPDWCFRGKCSEVSLPERSDGDSMSSTGHREGHLRFCFGLEKWPQPSNMQINVSCGSLRCR